MEEQVKSKQRIADYGEVLTGKREVNAMLNLVKQETERIESRFLEPACGTGNFLTEILERKLRIVEMRYRRSQLEYERNAVLAVSSIYGIDILEDSILECRKRLFGIFDWAYSGLYKKTAKNQCRNAVKYILEHNIIRGDALTLQSVGDNPQPIVFSEWSLVTGSKFKRRDFAFHKLFPPKKEKQRSLFSETDQSLFSDSGENVFIPMPIKEYSLTHFLRIADAAES